MSEINSSRIFETEECKVAPKPFPADKLILDIGGGGEGVTGLLNGRQVVSIDRLKEELEETANDALKIVMDASDLKFLDDTFDCAASFFTLMYIPAETRGRVLSEVLRTLKPGGEFRIWEPEIYPPGNCEKDIFIVPAAISVYETEIRTKYGIKWEGKLLDGDLLTKLLSDAGFSGIDVKTEGQLITAKAFKPESV